MDENRRALKALQKIGRPPYHDHANDVMVQRKWLNEYGGVERRIHSSVIS